MSLNSAATHILSSINTDLFSQFQMAGKDLIEGGYGMAFDHYEKGQYREAYDVFVLLAAAKPDDKKLWMGLGAACQMLRRYPEALEAYSVAAHLDERVKDPYPHFHAAECFFSVGDIKNAWKALESARKIAMKAEGEVLLKSRIGLLRKSWYSKAKALAKKKG